MCGPLWRFSLWSSFLVSSSLCSFMFIIELILVTFFFSFGFFFFFYLFCTSYNGFEYPYTHVIYISRLLAVHKKYCYNKLLVFLDKFWICMRYCPRHYACERGPNSKFMGDFTNLGVVAYVGRMRLCARCPYVDEVCVEHKIWGSRSMESSF